MLRLLAFDQGNVVLTEDEHKATSDTRKKASAPAIMQPQLQPGMTFVMTIWGTGVVKMLAFSSMTRAKDWFISGLHFPHGSTRMRTHETHYLTVSVFADRLVFTPIDQMQAPFYITTSPDSTLAFDIESGDVGINIGQLSYFGTPFMDHQRNLFEDFSPHLQTKESNNGSTIQSLQPNPLSLCQVAHAILSPGDVMEILVTGTGQMKDTGAYIRVWLLWTDIGDLYNPSWHVCGKMLNLDPSAMEAWHLCVRDREIILADRVTSQVLDTIAITTDVSHMRLALELYKASVSVGTIAVSPCRGNLQAQDHHAPSTLPSRFHSPFPAAFPKPHHSKVRRKHQADGTQQRKRNTEQRQPDPRNDNNYLTPVLSLYDISSIAPDTGGRGRCHPSMHHRQHQENGREQTTTTVEIHSPVTDHKTGRPHNNEMGEHHGSFYTDHETSQYNSMGDHSCLSDHETSQPNSIGDDRCFNNQETNQHDSMSDDSPPPDGPSQTSQKSRKPHSSMYSKADQTLSRPVQESAGGYLVARSEETKVKTITSNYDAYYCPRAGSHVFLNQFEEEEEDYHGFRREVDVKYCGTRPLATSRRYGTGHPEVNIGYNDNRLEKNDGYQGELPESRVEYHRVSFVENGGHQRTRRETNGGRYSIRPGAISDDVYHGSRLEENCAPHSTRVEENGEYHGMRLKENGEYHGTRFKENIEHHGTRLRENDEYHGTRLRENGGFHGSRPQQNNGENHNTRPKKHDVYHSIRPQENGGHPSNRLEANRRYHSNGPQVHHDSYHETQRKFPALEE